MEPIPLSFDPADGELHRILLHVLTLGGADVGAAEPEALVTVAAPSSRSASATPG